jgi:group I intron endonuclease
MVNGKLYVGITKHTLAKRRQQHLNAPTSRKRLTAIHGAIKKYGTRSFEFSIIDHASSFEELNQKEKYYIALLNSKAPHGYNLTAGGDGVCDPAPEVIEKNRRSHLGKKASEETKARMRASSKHLPMSEKTKEKLRQYLFTRVISAETREKIGAWQRGRKRAPLSPSTRQKIRIASIRNNTGAILAEAGKETRWKKGQTAWNKGKTHSAEWRANLSLSHKGKKQSEETKQKRSESLKRAYAEGRHPIIRVPQDEFGRFTSLTDSVQ